jgi:hypothetical protein
MRYPVLVALASGLSLVSCGNPARSAATDGGSLVDAQPDGKGDGAVADAGSDIDASPPSPAHCGTVHTIGVDGEFIHDPILGIDASGGVVALWQQGTDGRYRTGSVRAGRFDADAGWSSATAFEHGGDFGYPSYRVAVDPAGGAFAAWHDTRESHDHTIYTSRLVPGGGWTEVTRLPTQARFGRFASHAVAIDAAGDALIAWDHGTDGDGVHVISNSPHSGWGEDVLIADGATGDARIALGPDGRAMAIWNQSTDYVGAVTASFYAPGAGWSSPVTLDGNSGIDDLGFDGGGNLIAVWTRYALDLLDYQLWAARYAADVGWGEPVRLDVVGGAARADLAVAASGHAVLAWDERVPTDDGGMPRVVLATFDPASGWSAGEIQPAEVSAFGEAVGIDADGNALAIWHESEGSPDTGFQTNVYARRFAPGAWWGVEYRLIEGARDPQLAINARGDAVVAWTTDALNACALE